MTKLPATIRQAHPQDAQDLIDFVKTIAAEPGIYIALSPEEFTLTGEQEEQFIEEMAAADNSVFLVAEVDAQIVGALTMRGGNRLATRHTAMLGISVAKGCRGQGIGSALMQAALAFARSSQVLRRIELNVFSENAPAIRLYKRLGFVMEGHRRGAVYRHGRYYDNDLMALLLEESGR